MKNFSRAISDRLELALLQKMLFLGALAIAAACAVPLFYFGEKYEIEAASIAGVVVALGGLLVAFFTVPVVVEKMHEDKALSLREALVQTFFSYIMLASFLPLIGGPIGRALESRKRNNPFVANDD